MHIKRSLFKRHFNIVNCLMVADVCSIVQRATSSLRNAVGCNMCHPSSVDISPFAHDFEVCHQEMRRGNLHCD